MSRRVFGLGALALALATTLTVSTTVDAQAVPTPSLHYPTYVKGTETTPPYTAVATFPQPGPTVTDPNGPKLTANITSDPKTIAIGTSARLPNTLGFGAVFGDSLNKQYLSVETTRGTPGTTITITFAEALKPRSFGIAIGDIDGEEMFVSMTNGTTPLSTTQMGLQPAFNWVSGVTATEYSPTSMLDTVEKTVDNIWEIFDPKCKAPTSKCVNTSGVTSWFWPEAAVTNITIKSESFPSALPNAYYQLWIAYTATQVVTWDPETNHLLTDNSLTVTPTDAANTLPPTGGGTITYSVDASSTSDCTLTSPTTPEFTATTPGTCIITATAAATPDFLAGTATVTFQITTPPTPAPSNNSRQKPVPEHVVEVSGPELAATGAPAWPLWAGVAVMGSGVVVLWALRRQNRVSA